LANTTVAALAESCPYIDEFIGFRLKKRRPPFDQVGAYLAARRFAKRFLSSRLFQCAIIPRVDIDNGCALAMAYHADIPCRVGYAETTYPLKRIKNANYHKLLTHIVDVGSGTHEVEHTLQVATYLGTRIRDAHLELWPTADEVRTARKLVASVGQDHRPLIALSPGANLQRRQWPAAKFAALAAVLRQTHGGQIIIVGGSDANAAAQRIVDELGSSSGGILDLTGRTSLRETVAVLGFCDLFVGNDSGPLHLAAAMQVPCVEISCHPAAGSKVHANSPARYAPWQTVHRVLQPKSAIAPCSEACMMSYAHCITSISVEAVAAATQELLSAPGRHMKSYDSDECP
jgi:heptosyltransferase-2